MHITTAKQQKQPAESELCSGFIYDAAAVEDIFGLGTILANDYCSLTLPVLPICDPDILCLIRKILRHVIYNCCYFLLLHNFHPLSENAPGKLGSSVRERDIQRSLGQGQEE